MSTYSTLPLGNTVIGDQISTLGILWAVLLIHLFNAGYTFYGLYRSTGGEAVLAFLALCLLYVGRWMCACCGEKPKPPRKKPFTAQLSEVMNDPRLKCDEGMTKTTKYFPRLRDPADADTSNSSTPGSSKSATSTTTSVLAVTPYHGSRNMKTGDSEYRRPSEFYSGDRWMDYVGDGNGMEFIEQRTLDEDYDWSEDSEWDSSSFDYSAMSPSHDGYDQAPQDQGLAITFLCYHHLP